MGGLVCTVKFYETLIRDGYVELEITRNWIFGVIRTVGCGSVEGVSKAVSPKGIEKAYVFV